MSDVPEWAKGQGILPRSTGFPEKPPEVVEAERVVWAYNRAQEDSRRAAGKENREAWIASNVGQRFEVEVTGDHYDDRVSATFTARLVGVDPKESGYWAGQPDTLIWGNGVTTIRAELSLPIGDDE